MCPRRLPGFPLAFPPEARSRLRDEAAVQPTEPLGLPSARRHHVNFAPLRSSTFSSNPLCPRRIHVYDMAGPSHRTNSPWTVPPPSRPEAIWAPNPLATSTMWPSEMFPFVTRSRSNCLLMGLHEKTWGPALISQICSSDEHHARVLLTVSEAFLKPVPSKATWALRSRQLGRPAKQ